ncbi:MAG: RNA polymerase sigma-70 factor [Parabacteroides sp.]|nr:RNA polymerase sigma-70 factor [Parabacteroides sp.]
MSTENATGQTTLATDHTRIFRELFRCYYTGLCYEAHTYVKSKEIAEEIVDDVFGRLWEKKEAITIDTSARAYLIKAVHNACISYLRTAEARIPRECIDNRLTLHMPGESPFDYIVSLELENKLKEAVRRLPPQYGRAFRLSREKNLTYEEIACSMHLSVNTVKTYLKKALQHLQAELKDYL